jgi:hypothetical protein
MNSILSKLYLFTIPLIFISCGTIVDDSKGIQNQKGSISGGTVVTNSVSARLQVSATSSNLPDSIYLYKSENTRLMIQAIAFDGQGNFLFEDLDYGTYDIMSNDGKFGALFRTITISENTPKYNIPVLHFHPVSQILISNRVKDFLSIYFFERELIANASGTLTYPYINFPSDSKENQQTLNVIQSEGSAQTYNVKLYSGEIILETINTTSSLLVGQIWETWPPDPNGLAYQLQDKGFLFKFLENGYLGGEFRTYDGRSENWRLNSKTILDSNKSTYEVVNGHLIVYLESDRFDKNPTIAFKIGTSKGENTLYSGGVLTGNSKTIFSKWKATYMTTIHIEKNDQNKTFGSDSLVELRSESEFLKSGIEINTTFWEDSVYSGPDTTEFIIDDYWMITNPNTEFSDSNQFFIEEEYLFYYTEFEGWEDLYYFSKIQ